MRRKSIQASCIDCGKGPTSGNNRPRSLHKTKRIVFPNLVVVKNDLVCTRCLKTRRRHMVANVQLPKAA